VSEANIIVELDKPVSRRQWDYFLTHDNQELAIIVVLRDGRKCLGTPADRDQSSILLTLPECPDASATKIFSLPDGDAPFISSGRQGGTSISLAYARRQNAQARPEPA
jgi:hypothetical protein